MQVEDDAEVDMFHITLVLRRLLVTAALASCLGAHRPCRRSTRNRWQKRHFIPVLHASCALCEVRVDRARHRSAKRLERRKADRRRAPDDPSRGSLPHRVTELQAARPSPSPQSQAYRVQRLRANLNAAIKRPARTSRTAETTMRVIAFFPALIPIPPEELGLFSR